MTTTRKKGSPRDPMLDAIDSAYQKLPEQEAQTIDTLAVQVVNGVKMRRRGFTPVMFGYTSALELLAKLGVFLNSKEAQKQEVSNG